MEAAALTRLDEAMRKVGIGTDGIRDEAVFCTPELPIDSLSFIRLLVELENTFEVEINVPEISKGGLITYGRLKAYIDTHMEVSD